MSTHVLTDAGIWFAGYALSGDMNECELSLGADAVEKTCFGATARNYMPGLLQTAFGGAGLFNAANPDAPLAAAIGTAGDHLIVAPEAAVGAVAYMIQCLLADYSWGGAVGDANAFRLTAAAEAKPARGQIEVLETIAATGASDGVQLGALTSSQRLVAFAMTTAAPGGSAPTLDLTVQSDDNGDFSSATDRITFSQWTTRAHANGSVDGAVADDYWRFEWELGGSSSPDFGVVAAFGIVDI